MLRSCSAHLNLHCWKLTTEENLIYIQWTKGVLQTIICLQIRDTERERDEYYLPM